MHILRPAILALLAVAALPAALEAGDLEPEALYELPQLTVREVDWLQGTPTVPRGWAVVGRGGQSADRKITYIRLEDGVSCDVDLGKNVQDVQVFDGRIYVTTQLRDATQNGLLTLDPWAGSPPTGSPCDDTRVVDPGLTIPNASNVFVGNFFGGPHAIAANSFLRQACDAGYNAEDLVVTIYNVLSFTTVSTWRPGQDGFPRACDPCGVLCGPNDVFLWGRGGGIWLAVATLQDGVYLVEVTDPANPVTRAHFDYIFDGRDEAGDPVPDLINATVDVAVSPDGRYLFTTDQIRFGGHLMVWDVEQVLADCSDPADPCTDRDVAPVGEYFPDGTPPGFAHKILLDWPYLWLTYFDYGLVLLDMTEPEDPVEIARYDVLPSHPAGSRSLWGAYGAALAVPCGGSWPTDILVSSVGIWNEPPTPDDRPGGVLDLYWAGESSILEPLRIGSDPPFRDNLVYDWARAPLTENYRIYAGTLDGTGSVPDSHDVPDTNFCDLPCCAWSLPDPGPDDALEYFLMRTVNGCGRLGSLGEGTEGPRVDPEPTICP